VTQDCQKRKYGLAIQLFLSATLVSCASTPASLNVKDGNPGAFETRNGIDRLIVNSEWKDGRPIGFGTFQWFVNGNLASICKASINSLSKDVYFASNGVMIGTGDIQDSKGRVIYSGKIHVTAAHALGCMLNGDGVFIREDGWKVEGEFAGTIQKASLVLFSDAGRFSKCIISDPSGKPRWKGMCYSGEHGLNANNPFMLAVGRGSMGSENGEYIDVDFPIATGIPKDGLARLTAPGEAIWAVNFMNGKIVARHLAPESITSKAIKGCSPWQGFTAVEGRCTAGRWNGAVQAYSADSERRISGQFANGTPQGDIEYSELSTGVRIRGHAATGGGAFGFTQGRLYQAGVMTYDGLFSGVQPNGRGTCVYQGAPESCEYYNGARVDALYKTRQDNERTQLAQEKARQQQEQARQQQAQAQARQSKDSNWGLKAMVIGGVAAIAGNSGIAIDKQVEIVSNVATDVLSDGKTSNTSNMLSNQQQEVINKSSASAASDKKPASVSNIAASNRGQINSVAKACNRQVGAIVSLNSKQQYTEAAEACKTVAPQGFVWGTDSGEGNGSAEGSCKKAVHEAYDGKYAKTACYCYQDHNPAAYSALSPGSWICWVGEGG
jgi:hypothetical protein